MGNQTKIPVEKIKKEESVNQETRKAGKASTIKSLSTVIKNLKSSELCTDEEIKQMQEFKTKIITRYINE